MEFLNRKLSLALAVVSILTAFHLSTPAQTRVRFKRGASSTTVYGQLSSRQLKKVFVIGAQAGQRLTARVSAKTSDGLDFALLDAHSPSGEVLEAGMQELDIRLPRNGDYRISVTPPGSFYNEKLKGYKQLRFTLYVQIN